MVAFLTTVLIFKALVVLMCMLAMTFERTLVYVDISQQSTSYCLPVAISN